MPLSLYAYDFEVDGIYYSYDIGKTLKVNGVSGYGSISIPGTVIFNGITYSVTSIHQYAFQGCDGLTSISIPDGVESIGYCAFDDCENLTSVTIPESVTSIGGFAFNDCENLTSVTIPEGVTSIGGWAFANCI